MQGLAKFGKVIQTLWPWLLHLSLRSCVSSVSFQLFKFLINLGWGFWRFCISHIWILPRFTPLYVNFDWSVLSLRDAMRSSRSNITKFNAVSIKKPTFVIICLILTIFWRFCSFLSWWGRKTRLCPRIYHTGFLSCGDWNRSLLKSARSLLYNRFWVLLVVLTLLIVKSHWDWNCVGHGLIDWKLASIIWCCRLWI